MEDKILVLKRNIPSYFEEEYQEVIEQLCSHMKNKEYFLHNRQVMYKGIKIKSDFSTKNLNHSHFIDCIFDGCNLDSASFLDSRFISCKFINCNLKATNFHCSLFCDVSFNSNCIFDGTKLSACKLVKCLFNGCNLNSVALDETLFDNCLISDAFWYANSTYLCKFSNTSFTNIKFRNMNLEFAIFENIHMNKMKLPFPTIPYIFGGFQYLQSTSDCVNVTSQHDIKNGIKKDDYLNLLNKLEIFYSYSNNYFPLANIYIAQQKIDNCKSAIILGIEKALQDIDLIILENIVRLASMNSLFSTSERYALLNHIVSMIPQCEHNTCTPNEINKCIYNIRTLLLNGDNNKSSFHLSIKTNIEDNNKKIYILIAEIENIFKCFDEQKNYSIEIRHNSPYEIFINCFSNYETICCILGLLIFTLKSTDKVLSKITSHISSFQNIKKQQLENQILEQQKKLNDLEIEKLNNELSNGKNVAKESYINIKNENITIGAISYITITDKSNTIIESSDVII